MNGVEDDQTSVEGVSRVKSNGLSTSDGVSNRGGLVDGDDGVSLRVDGDETLGPLEDEVEEEEDRKRSATEVENRANEGREREGEERKGERTEVAASW